MGYADNMSDIVSKHAGEKLRFFIRADPDSREQSILYARDDLEWSDEKADAVDKELLELVAKEGYEAALNAGKVTQLIKVAGEMILFTGFIEDEVVVVSFDRGVLGALPPMVAEFREYMQANDIEFTQLAME
ncbi:hypothetical protein [Halosegnis sp.]|uniref:hypothetical protein n=1 Tax=Halosegnis sp. TaxID=2864959 RepID=UPI0035D44CFB